MMFQLNRRSFGATIAALSLVFACGAATAGRAEGTREPGAEAFVKQGAERVLAVLADKGTSELQKEAVFHRAVDDLADVPKITNFVLGKYARSITPAQRAQFSPAFRTYEERVYRDRLEQYGGETVQILGSATRKPGDVIVSTKVSGGRLKEPVPLSWRVMGQGSAWKVVDVEFQGVWLAITQQQDFVSAIDNAHGDVNVLIARLQRDAQRRPPAR